MGLLSILEAKWTRTVLSDYNQPQPAWFSSESMAQYGIDKLAGELLSGGREKVGLVSLKNN